MDENEFELDGKFYSAYRSTDGCAGCAFECDAHKCLEAPDCFRGLQYNPEVIFIEAAQ